MAAPVRRSRRERKVNPRHLDSTEDQETVRDLDESPAPPSKKAGGGSDMASSSRDTEFEIGGVSLNVDRELPAEDDAISVSSASDSQSSPASRADSDDAEIHSEDSDYLQTARHPKARFSRTGTKPPGPRSRGVKQIHRKGAKDVVYPQIFGPDLDDLRPILRARDTWLNAHDITFPSRTTLSAANPELAELPVIPSPPSDIPENLSPLTVPKPRDQQKTGESESPLIYSKPSNSVAPCQSVFLGPWENQSVHQIPALGWIEIGKAWLRDGVPQSPAEYDHSQNSPTSYHHGWLLNVGAKVQCLSWAPGNTVYQYLAVSCKCPSTQRASGMADVPVTSPAFHPSAAYPSNIQIWAFESNVLKPYLFRGLSYTAPPRLALNIKTDCGDIRYLRWAPLMSQSSSEPFDLSGSLALLSSDGCVRVLHVHMVDFRKDSNSKTLQSLPFIEITPPLGVLFTTLAWASCQDLALGASDGFVRLYNVPFRLDKGLELEPFFSHQLHSTYIVSLCPAIPSTIPNMLASYSASGDFLLTDLRSPHQDQIQLQKSCLLNKALVYAPFTRSFITSTDHGVVSEPTSRPRSAVVCHHIRRFYTGIQVAKLPELSGSTTALAGSIYHPSLLIGNAKGTVFATNYLRKVLPGPRQSKSSKLNTCAFLQKLCEYEWQPSLRSPTREDDVIATETDIYHGHDVRAGISRFQEGFSPEKIDLTPGSPFPRKRKKADNEPAAETIFDDEQAVTAIDWSPNPHFAGWAAIGWGSGIVRVQDLSYEDTETIQRGEGS